MEFSDLGGPLGLAFSALTLLGAVSAVDAVMSARSPQGAVAWAISLLTFPYLAVPLYWVLGRRRFHGYRIARRAKDLRLKPLWDEVLLRLAPHAAPFEREEECCRVFAELARVPLLDGNEAVLLRDGGEIFPAIFDVIERAERTVLAEVFILKDDGIGRRFADALKARARDGVSVRLLYDEIGSHKLPASYVHELREAGVDVRSFHTRRGRRNRFQINFRNHRKVVVADGAVAVTSGANVADEYLGKGRLGDWRDTGVLVRGPAALAFQLAFLEDWYWATSEVPEFDWTPRPVERSGVRVLVLPMGPADALDTGELFFAHAIQCARRRVWIASPYFVPDSAVLASLQLAALRGVDVRILLPSRPDHRTVYLASFSFLPETEPHGVRIYRYRPGERAFMHQKVVLVDDLFASVGTANLDNRSFRLNFEINALGFDRAFVAEVERMLVRDFKASRRESLDAFEKRPYAFRFLARCARLLAPLL